MPNWVPRLSLAEESDLGCSSIRSLTGGPIQLVQYEFFLDKNDACPLS
jgi:hypothetical protein